MATTMQWHIYGRVGRALALDAIEVLAIRLFIIVSIISCQRSFSKLKLILSYLRVSMTVEREENKKNFDHIENLFASAKARKEQL